MKFSKEEQEIIKAFVDYENISENIADAFNISGLLEKRGIAIVDADDTTLVFFRMDMHPNFFPNAKYPYIPLLLNLIEKLVQNGSIICGDSVYTNPLVIGARYSRWEKLNTLAVNNTEVIILKGPYKGWYDKTNKQMVYWEWNEYGFQLKRVCHYLHSNYSVSEELKELVKNDFKTDEEIRFAKQQRITWISIIVAALLGILGIIF